MDDKHHLFFETEADYKKAKLSTLYNAHTIVVNCMIIKNRFGDQNVRYCGSFGVCLNCNKEIKERELLSTRYIGCMC